LHARLFQHLSDDAYISFRYAANLAEGAGLTFNRGEYVMGYSNFLWVVLLGLGEALGVPSPIVAPVLGMILGGAIVVVLYVYLRSAYESVFAATAGAALLVTNGTFACWVVGGLEGPLFGLLLLIAVVLSVRMQPESSISRYAVLGVVFGLAALTRPEGVFYTAPTAAYLILQEPTRQRMGRVFLFVGIALAFYGLFIVWSVFYYADPLPNPFYAKFHPLSLELLARGYRFSELFVVGYLGVPLAIIGLWALTTRLRLRSAGWLPLSIVVVFMVFYVRTGGDAQVYYRMWFWVLPMFALLLGEAAAVLYVGRDRQLISVVLVVGLLAGSLQHSFRGNEIGRIGRDEAFVRGATLIGETLAQEHPGATIAANNVGALTYASRMQTLDMLGLTDRHIAKAPGKSLGIPAHESHDGTYVLDQGPDFIFYGMPKPYSKPLSVAQATNSGYPSDLDLRRDPRLIREYVFVNLVLSDGTFAPVFRRIDYSTSSRASE
jgi:hypothetical protein